MAKRIKLAVLVEKKNSLRKKVANQIHLFGVQKIIQCATPNLARRPVILSNKPGLLVIGNSNKLDDGLSLISFCRTRLASWTILVLDHLNSDESAAQAISAGADDVLHVPFSNSEFQARLKLRLKQAASPNAEDLSNIKTPFADANLTQTELEIMNILMARKGKIVTRNQLSRHLENKDWAYGDRKYDVHITSIRKKLRENLGEQYTVKSVRSVGYFVQQVCIEDTL
ncbi:MAG: winged helix-turn-helix domain-containing protein [Amylibacter sp.]